jgi:O-antigen/teichoic acid export membrane protein
MNRRAIFLSLVEQGLTSLGMLAMTAAVIAASAPDVFGQFALIITLVMIAASLQFGFVGTSMLVEVRPLDEAGRVVALDALSGFDFYYRLLAALIVGGVAFEVSHDAALACAASVFALVYLWREFTRYTLFAIEEVGRATALGAVAFSLLMLALAASLSAMDSASVAALLSSAAANAVAVGAVAGSHHRRPRHPVAAIRAYRARFPRTGWTVLNSVANEIQTRTHVVAVQIFRGVDQLGIVEATRVLFAPLILIASAWQRLMQPRLAALVAEGRIGTARSLTLAGVGAVVAVSVLYSGAVFLAFDVIASRLFGDRYGDLSAYAAAWAAYATLLVVNWTLISFMNALQAFSQVAKMTMVAAAATALLLLLLAFDVPLLTALVVPILVQGAVCVALLVSLARADLRGGREAGEAA